MKISLSLACRLSFAVLMIGCADDSGGADGGMDATIVVDAGRRAEDAGGEPDAGWDAAIAIDAADEADAASDAGSDAGPCLDRCSNDLRSIVDCHGTTRTTCPSGEGCGADLTCVPACEAAIASQSTVGCEYYAHRTSGFGCYAAFVTNGWDLPVTIELDTGGAPMDASPFARLVSGHGAGIVYSPLPDGAVPPGEVALVFLAGTCPDGITPPAAPARASFHIRTSLPVTAYDIDPYGGGASAVTSASLLIPTSTWDLEYMAIAPWPFGPNSQNPRLSITAAEDATEVTIDPRVAITGGFIGETAVLGSPAGTPITYTLDRGQTLQLEQQAELTGSAISATKPIGVSASSGCIGIGACCCDGAHQQLLPLRALGSAYAAVRYRNRVDGMEEASPWRVVGAVDGTVLTYDPGPPPEGAPTTINRGEAIIFNAPGPFLLTSQDADHPFYLAAYMTGAGDFMNRGDPEYVSVIPVQQFRSSYVFFTDPTYPETNLVVTRARHHGIFHDVTLGCAGVLTGWAPVDSAAELEYTRVDLVRENFVPQGACDNGRHEMSSDAPFGVTVWAWGSDATAPAFTSTYVSYAYPAGANVQSINDLLLD